MFECLQFHLLSFTFNFNKIAIGVIVSIDSKALYPTHIQIRST